MLYRAEVKVSLKKAILDPQGRAVEGAIKTLGYTNVPEVRIGKLVELTIEAESEQAAKAQVQELGKKILSNPVMETFSFTIAEVK
jgi:phosphoribosylformylglycinamidine synthase